MWIDTAIPTHKQFSITNRKNKNTYKTYNQYTKKRENKKFIVNVQWPNKAGSKQFFLHLNKNRKIEKHIKNNISLK